MVFATERKATKKIVVLQKLSGYRGSTVIEINKNEKRNSKDVKLNLYSIVLYCISL